MAPSRLTEAMRSLSDLVEVSVKPGGQGEEEMTRLRVDATQMPDAGPRTLEQVLDRHMDQSQGNKRGAGVLGGHVGAETSTL